MADKIYENRIAARTVEEGEYYDSLIEGDMEDGYFYAVSVNDSKFSKNKLLRSRFEKVYLTGTDIEGADLSNTEWRGCIGEIYGYKTCRRGVRRLLYNGGLFFVRYENDVVLQV